MTRQQPLVIGHRGAPGYRPEHSRASYDLALATGVDAVEPDVVATKDGVLVVRHENEISGTTDVAEHPEFADRRTTKTVDGQRLTGWFTEDFTWDELSRLRTRERIPKLRPDSAAYDGEEPILRLTEVLELVDRASEDQGRPIGVVLEVKHPTYFASIGLDLVPLILRDLREAGWRDGRRNLVVESFEQSALARLQAAGLPAAYVYLLEASGRAPDVTALLGDLGPTYARQLTPRGLDVLADRVDGISLNKRTILAPDASGKATGPAPVVDEAHQRGLQVFTWTARPENRFLTPEFAHGRSGDFGDYRSEWALLRDAGVDGVFVDHPDLGVEVFRGGEHARP